MENRKERIPYFDGEINLPYTKGKYKFFCQNISKLLEKVLWIISSGYFQEKSLIFLISCLWTVNHTKNKLEGICSISSSVKDNCFCKARQKIKNCICQKCYAENQQSYQNGLKEHSILNGIILRNVLIPIKFFKLLKIVFPYLRIESFGDVQNVIQARNYIRIIKAFPEKRCAIWSKNIYIWKQAFDEEGKPKNTTYVHSSNFINKPDKINLEKYPFVDHVFTVYSRKFAKENNIVINCDGKKCLECIMKRKNCYYRVNKNNNTFYINELQK